MTTQQVADKFMELANQGKYDQIQDELYAENCESIEPTHSQNLTSVTGITAIKEKGKKASLIQKVIPFSDIIETKVLVSFK